MYREAFLERSRLPAAPKHKCLFATIVVRRARELRWRTPEFLERKIGAGSHRQLHWSSGQGEGHKFLQRLADVAEDRREITANGGCASDDCDRDKRSDQGVLDGGRASVIA
jgi:hypothetical protein